MMKILFKYKPIYSNHPAYLKYIGLLWSLRKVLELKLWLFLTILVPGKTIQLKNLGFGTISLKEVVVSCLDSLAYSCKPKVEDSKQSTTPSQAQILSNFEKVHSHYPCYI